MSGLSSEERFEVWGDFDPSEYAEEVEERWGNTDAYKESQRRVSRYTKDDWKQLNAETAEITRRLVEAMNAGEPPTSEVAMGLAEEHRQHLTRWFYDCSYEMHQGLAKMYVADPRFKANYEKVAEGLAQFLRDAIVANAAR